MEDVFKFLLVAAVIVIGLVKQFKKEANKNADKSPDIPMPDVDNPLPEYWGGDTYGGFIPEGPKPAEKPKPVSKPSAKSKHTSIKASPPSPASRPQESDEVTSEYGIHSAEEARKAIIWSEILQRKYKRQSIIAEPITSPFRIFTRKNNYLYYGTQLHFGSRSCEPD